MEAIVITAVLIFFLSTGISVALSFIGASAILYIIFTEIPLITIANNLFSKLDSFTLESILFFILLGNIMKVGDSSKNLIQFAKSLMLRLPGGLGIAGVTACTIFGAISGSAAATLVALGTVLIPAMIEAGYEKYFSIGLITSASVLGVIIPPSILMIIYSVVANVSVAKLFLGGFIPGIIIAFLLSVYTFLVRRKKRDLNKREKLGVIDSTAKAVWALVLPVIVLGGIYGGVFTPTEAAIVGCVYALIIETIISKKIKIKNFIEILRASGMQSGTLLFTLAGASVFGDYLTILQIPQDLSIWLVDTISSPTKFLIGLNLLFLFLGTFLDPLSAIILVAPLLMPAIQALGIDPIFIGIILTVNLGIGYCTPPLGANLFTATMIFNEKFSKVTIAVIPTMLIFLFCLVIFNMFPSIITFLPEVLGQN